MRASDFLLFLFVMIVSITALFAIILWLFIREFWPVFALVAVLKIYGWLVVLGAI